MNVVDNGCPVLQPFITNLSAAEMELAEIQEDLTIKKSARMISSNQTMKNFFTSRCDPTTTDLKADAAEGTWIFNFILSSIQENGLNLNQLTSFCADNAPVNLGGSQHKGQNNVFCRLKERTAHLIPVGCPAHILHNAGEKASNRLTVDIETIVLKIGSHFKSQTGGATSLKQFCEQLIPTTQPYPLTRQLDGQLWMQYLRGW